jgi:predicted ATPase/DNA-binding winged helix-turn-helix (wHTH) protein
MATVSDRPAVVEFGRFRVVPHRRQLLVDGRPIVLGGRTFDLLMALIEASGAVIGKDALLSRIWPNRIVDENRLQGEISALRKAFGPDRELIQTVAGRGYQFTGEIRQLAVAVSARETPAIASAAALSPRPATNISESMSELIGREADLSEVAELMTTHRLVTLIGEGGIGKTRLGLGIARQLIPEFADGVWVAELAPLSDPDLVPVTVATAFGLELTGGAVSAERVANVLSAKRLLLVLDNCEHVVSAATSIAEALLRTNSTMRVLATSREPLRAEGECLYRVPPLAVPTDANADVDELLRYGAVRLFVARARSADPHFSVDGPTAATSAAICRRLDGIPLAIELAAARGAVLGIAEIAARLDDRFHLLTGGRRAGLPRHRTLRATLDWSYELLPEPERVVLRRLAIFAVGFTLAAASAVVSSAEIAASDVIDCVANLVTKSLVTRESGDALPQYRLLETTRAYAIEELSKSSELDLVAHRHADYYRNLLDCAQAEWATRPTSEWLPDYRWQIGNVRAALDWSFSPDGDVPMGVALTIAAVPLWSQLSLMEECRTRVERALASIELNSRREARQEMLLYAALGASLNVTKGPVPETSSAWACALELAERLGDTQCQLCSLWGLWDYRFNRGEHRTALALARRFCSLAAGTTDPSNLLVGNRMIGVVLHFLGDQTSARVHIERVLATYIRPAHRSSALRFGYDQLVTARAAFARILWLQGFPDQAIAAAQRAVDDAQSLDHAPSLCNALAQALCTMALFVGDAIASKSWVAMLLDRAARYELPVWHARGRCFEGVLLSRRGDAMAGSQLLQSSLEDLREAGSALYYTAFLGALAESFATAGQIARGLVAIDEALAISERTEERWCMAEFLRIKGRLVLLGEGARAAGLAEDDFREALDWARGQGTLSCELRVAISLARLWRDQDRAKEAHELLGPVYDRFTEGFETPDLQAARGLITELQ